MTEPAQRDEKVHESVDISITALRAWSYSKRGFVNEDEPTDPEHILAYAHVDIAIGSDFNRRTVQSERGARYALMKGAATMALIGQLSTGWGAFSPDQSEVEDPAFGIYPTAIEAEAEVVCQSIGRKRGSNET